MGYRGELIFLPASPSAQKALLVAARPDLQMNRHTPGPQVIDPQHTADNISSHIVENQHFPYRLAIFVQDRCGLRDQAGR